MRVLSNLNGRWNPQRSCIEFSWDVSGLDNDRFIFIFPLEKINNEYKLNVKNAIIHDVANIGYGSVNSASVPLGDAQVGVSLKQYCAFSHPDRMIPQETDILKACDDNKDFVSNVMIGRAMIEYSIKRTECGNATVIELSINSNSVIEHGVLGYQYRCGLTVIKESFPGIIQRGIDINYPQIAIPSDSDIQIIPIDDRFTGNILLSEKNKKNSFFESIKVFKK